MGNVGSADINTTYHLQKVKLGEGAFGVVWRGVHRQTGDVVAVKQLSKKSLPARGVRRADVEREIKMMASCEHENIIRLFQTFEDSESIYMALEYCEGGDFGDKVLERGLKIQEAEMALWTLQMLSAITFLHSKLICHRDVKPDNFLVAQSPSGQLLKLADMGLAIPCPANSLLTDRCGTPAFMAPEQHLMPHRSKGYGLQVDVWAVGLCMYMLMFGGRHPFLNARGALNKASMLDGQMDFRDPGGFLSSLGMGGLRMSDEARGTCQAMVCPELRQRMSSQAALAAVAGMAAARASAAPSRSSGAASMGAVSYDSRRFGEHSPAPSTAPSALFAGEASTPGGGTAAGVGATLARKMKLEKIKDCVAAKILPGLPSRPASADGRRRTGAAPRGAGGGAPPPGVPLWEFSVRDGFTSFQAEAHEVLEEQYQAFLEGRGPPVGKVVTLGREVEVDFREMEQHIKNSAGRRRKVRRNMLGGS